MPKGTFSMHLAHASNVRTSNWAGKVISRGNSLSVEGMGLPFVSARIRASRARHLADMAEYPAPWIRSTCEANEGRIRISRASEAPLPLTKPKQSEGHHI